MRTWLNVPFADIIVMGREEMISLGGVLAYAPSVFWPARAPAGGEVYISVLGYLHLGFNTH